MKSSQPVPPTVPHAFLTCGVPTPDDLAAAISTLHMLPSRPSGSMVEVATHLVLPASDAVGLDAVVSKGKVSWRGASVRVPEHDVEAATHVLAEFVSGLLYPSDRFVDLASPPSTWVKPLRSGSRTVLYGSKLLFGRDVDSAPGALSADLYAATSAPPGLSMTEGGTALVDVSPTRIVLSPTAPSAATSAVTEVLSPAQVRSATGETVDWVAATLDMDPDEWTAAPIGFSAGGWFDVDLVAARDGWFLLVPVTVYMLGQLGPFGLAGAAVPSVSNAPFDMDTPDGWSPLGVSVFEEGLFAAHRSGLPGFLRRYQSTHDLRTHL